MNNIKIKHRILEIIKEECDGTYAENVEEWNFASPSESPKILVDKIFNLFPENSNSLKTGVELIALERQRQVDIEGWSKEHDQEHNCGQLSDAAVCYAMRGYWKKRLSTWVGVIWPFDAAWYKPSPEDRVKELVKAGALIAAEIDRIQAYEE